MYNDPRIARSIHTQYSDNVHLCIDYTNSNHQRKALKKNCNSCLWISDGVLRTHLCIDNKLMYFMALYHRMRAMHLNSISTTRTHANFT